MRMIKLNCKRCNSPIFCDVMVLAAKAPVHCSSCDSYLEPSEYEGVISLPQGVSVPDLVKPLGWQDTEVGQIIYRPAADS